MERVYCDFGFMVRPLQQWEIDKTMKAFKKVVEASGEKGLDPHKYPSVTHFIDVYRTKRAMNLGIDSDNEYMFTLTYFRGYLVLTFLSYLDECDMKEVDEIIDRLGGSFSLYRMRKANKERTLQMYEMKLRKNRKPIIP